MKRALNTAYEPLIGAEWKKTRTETGGGDSGPPDRSWTPVVTPPFPSRWPPEGNRRAVRYLYATSFDPQVMDGVRVAAPWGHLECSGGDRRQPRFVRMAGTIREIGIQGVRPITKEEMAIYEKGGMAESCLQALAGLPDESDPGASLLRNYYRTWCGHNGVIVGEIVSLYEPFFRWAGCRE